jgi:hypothetical protein
MNSEHSHIQKAFSPADYTFRWTDDNWYAWDRKPAHKKALADRNRRARELRQAGWDVKVGTIPHQRIKRGGIGTGHPDIELVCTVYLLTARKPVRSL